MIIISLHLDIWSNNEFTSWSFSFNSLWRKRIWLSKWPINLSEWFSGVFAILDCNSSFLKIITSFKKYFSRDSNSSVITDLKFLKQFSTLTWFFNRFSWLLLFDSVGRDRHCQFPIVFRLTELLFNYWFNSLPKVALVTASSSVEPFTKLNTSSLAHLLFFLFSVWIDAIMSNSTSSFSVVSVFMSHLLFFLFSVCIYVILNIRSCNWIQRHNVNNMKYYIDKSQ